MKLLVPEAHKDSLRRLARLDPQERSRLLAAVSQFPPTRALRQSARRVAEELARPEEDIVPLVMLLASLHEAREYLGADMAEVRDALVEAARSLLAQDGRETDVDWDTFARQAATALAMAEPADTDGAHPTPETGSIADIFNELAEAWEQATLYSSSPTEMATHPAYQQIIGMGPRVLPLVFRRLRREPGPWFWALKAITRTDPVPVESRGNVEEMTRAWLSWADRQGLIADDES